MLWTEGRPGRGGFDILVKEGSGRSCEGAAGGVETNARSWGVEGNLDDEDGTARSGKQ